MGMELLKEALPVMGWGWLGVFLATGGIRAAVALIIRIFSGK